MKRWKAAALFLVAWEAAHWCFADDVASPKFVREWGAHGTGPGEFDFPIGIAMTRSGELLITDFYNDRLQRFSPDGKFQATFPVLHNPGGIAVDAQGEVYLTHFPAMGRDKQKGPDRISVYSAEGKLLRQWGKTGKEPGEFDYPGGLAISADGKVYICDQTNRRVQVFDREGKFLFQWGRYGVQEGEFGGNSNRLGRVGGPQFVAIAPDGTVFTTEGSMCRVQQFTPEGKFLRAWGSDADKLGGFGGTWMKAKPGLQGAVGICFGGPDRLWVCAVSGRIQQFSKEGKLLAAIDRGAGTGSGQFMAPHGVVADGKGNLYVVDSFNYRIQQFAVESR